MVSEARSGGGSSSGEPTGDTDRLGDVGWEAQGGEEPSLTSIHPVWVEQSPAPLLCFLSQVSCQMMTYR